MRRNELVGRVEGKMQIDLETWIDATPEAESSTHFSDDREGGGQN